MRYPESSLTVKLISGEHNFFLEEVKKTMYSCFVLLFYISIYADVVVVNCQVTYFYSLSENSIFIQDLKESKLTFFITFP